MLFINIIIWKQNIFSFIDYFMPSWKQASERANGLWSFCSTRFGLGGEINTNETKRVKSIVLTTASQPASQLARKQRMKEMKARTRSLTQSLACYLPASLSLTHSLCAIKAHAYRRMKKLASKRNRLRIHANDSLAFQSSNSHHHHHYSSIQETEWLSAAACKQRVRGREL